MCVYRVTVLSFTIKNNNDHKETDPEPAVKVNFHSESMCVDTIE